MAKMYHTGVSVKLCILLTMAVCMSAWAEYNTNGETGVVRTFSAKTSGKATLNVGAGINIGQYSKYFQGPNNGTKPLLNKNGQIVTADQLESARLLSSNLFLGTGLLSFWDIAVSLPFYYDLSGINEYRDGGLGDLELSTKIKLPIKNKVFYQGYYLAGTVPVGMKKNGIFPRHPYYMENTVLNPAEYFYSINTVTFKALALISLDFGGLNTKFPLQLHFNLGGAVSTDQNQSNLFIGSFAFDYTPAEFITIFTDLHAETRFANIISEFDPRRDPIIVSPGFRIQTHSGIYLTFATDLSLSSNEPSDRLNWKPGFGRVKNVAYSTGIIPKYAVEFIFGWNGFLTVQDDDKDGIKNDEDRCLKEAEDVDGFEDGDGCPDPDNDRDNIEDLKDKCPNEIEDKDGFNDEDGCPDLDNDSDGIQDLKDQCPNDAEDFDGFEDRDGCPDPDNDKDGIIDSADKCPNDVEDFDSFDDTDGCPDPDNDKDGIPDLKDACPSEPEVFNNLDDKDGCPDTIAVKKEIDMPKEQILQGVLFKSGSPEMTFESFQYIEPVVKKLKQYPEVSIEVRGHTDAVGNFDKNMKLSQMRAEAVRQYLISKGIESERIRAVGFGSSSPIADNRTAVGRTQNRRIEIIRLK